MPSLTNAALFVPLFFAMMSLCVCLQRRHARRRGEWNYLTPGPYYWLGLVSGLIIAAVTTMVVAGGRVDPQSGAVFATVFIGLTIAIALQGILQETRWSRTRIHSRTVFMREHMMAWPELARTGVAWTGSHWISSFDGPRMHFSPYDNGFEQLQAKIAHHLPRDRPPAEPVVAAEMTVQFAPVSVRR